MNWRIALLEHWLFSMECVHEISCDVAHCACGWKSELQPTVGQAVQKWIEHVAEFAEGI